MVFFIFYISGTERLLNSRDEPVSSTKNSNLLVFCSPRQVDGSGSWVNKYVNFPSQSDEVL